MGRGVGPGPVQGEERPGSELQRRNFQKQEQKADLLRGQCGPEAEQDVPPRGPAGTLTLDPPPSALLWAPSSPSEPPPGSPQRHTQLSSGETLLSPSAAAEPWPLGVPAGTRHTCLTWQGLEHRILLSQCPFPAPPSCRKMAAALARSPAPKLQLAAAEPQALGGSGPSPSAAEPGAWDPRPQTQHTASSTGSATPWAPRTQARPPDRGHSSHGHGHSKSR